MAVIFVEGNGFARVIATGRARCRQCGKKIPKGERCFTTVQQINQLESVMFDLINDRPLPRCRYCHEIVPGIGWTTCGTSECQEVHYRERQQRDRHRGRKKAPDTDVPF